MKKILVSACLCGTYCKYNGSTNTCMDTRFLNWKDDGLLIPVCPEVDGGLSVPREPAERQLDQAPIIASSLIKGRVITKSSKDVTQAYIVGALRAVALAKKHNVICCILKHKSPACGNALIYDGNFSGNLITGEGIAAELLRKNGFRVFNESELDKVEMLLCSTVHSD